MSNVLVSGCAGFIGSSITERLLKDGHNVTGIDNFDRYYDMKIKERNISSFKDCASFEFIRGSILDPDILDNVSNDIEVIYHQAATAGVRYSLCNPLKYNDNPRGTLALLEKFRDIKKFVYASSSSVYGELSMNKLPVTENFTPNPVSPYAVSKLIGEGWCELYSRIYGIKTAILRYFTVYGPRQRPDEAINKFVNGILECKNIQIYGDGEQTRDFVYIDDVVNANMLSMMKGKGIINIASGTRTSINKLIEIIQDKLGIEANKVYVDKQAGDVSHTLANIIKAKDILGFVPEFSIERGIELYCNWMKNNRI